MRKIKKVKACLLMLIALCGFVGGSAEAIVTPPATNTLPLDNYMITRVKDAGEIQGLQEHRYVQITGKEARNAAGAVWFNSPIDFRPGLEQRSAFELTMAVYLENVRHGLASADSDGVAFVMQSQGLGAIAHETGTTIGVHANKLWPNASELGNTGAIANSLAIEFDTFKNDGPVSFGVGDGSMDSGLGLETFDHHIAWMYPGKSNSYERHRFFGADYARKLKHNGFKKIDDITDSKWHEFTVKYDGQQTITYSIPDYGITQSIPLNDQLANDFYVDTFAEKPVYFGFTGANGANAQDKAVTFLNADFIEVDWSGKIKQNGTDILDVKTGQPHIPTVTNDPITYDLTAEIKRSALYEIAAGQKVTITVPEELLIKDNQITINGVVYGPGDIAKKTGVYQRNGDQVTLSLNKIEKTEANKKQNILFDVEIDPHAAIDKNFSQEIPVTVSWDETIYNKRYAVGDNVNGVTSRYKLEKKFLPTIDVDKGTDKAADVPASEGLAVEQRDEITVTPGIQDENSTKVQLYYSKPLSKEEIENLGNNDYTPTDEDKTGPLYSRGTIDEPFTGDPLNLDTSDWPPGEHYIAIYGKDTEGNISNRQYLKIFIEGLLTLDRVPNFYFNKTDLNSLNISASQHADGFGRIAMGMQPVIPDHTKIDAYDGNNDLALQITDERLHTRDWLLTASLGSFVRVDPDKPLKMLPETDVEIELANVGSGTNRKIINNAASEVIRSSDLNDGNQYQITIDANASQIKVKPAQIDAGRYQGVVTWTLTNSIGFN